VEAHGGSRLVFAVRSGFWGRSCGTRSQKPLPKAPAAGGCLGESRLGPYANKSGSNSRTAPPTPASTTHCATTHFVPDYTAISPSRYTRAWVPSSGRDPRPWQGESLCCIELGPTGLGEGHRCVARLKSGVDWQQPQYRILLKVYRRRNAGADAVVVGVVVDRSGLAGVTTSADRNRYGLRSLITKTAGGISTKHVSERSSDTPRWLF
jgi:hypothetical protein